MSNEAVAGSINVTGRRVMNIYVVSDLREPRRSNFIPVSATPNISKLSKEAVWRSSRALFRQGNMIAFGWNDINIISLKFS
jgi:hypothetical protein